MARWGVSALVLRRGLLEKGLCMMQGHGSFSFSSFPWTQPFSSSAVVWQPISHRCCRHKEDVAAQAGSRAPRFHLLLSAESNQLDLGVAFLLLCFKASAHLLCADIKHSPVENC